MLISDFGILAPAPYMHLESGAEVAKNKGYTSFGSMKWELFQQVDELRDNVPVPVFIYPSFESDLADMSMQIKWVGWYIGHVVDMGDKVQDEKEGHRPPSTVDNPRDRASQWALLWRVCCLNKLPDEYCKTISEFKSHSTGKWRNDSPPRGPELIERPGWV